MKNPLTHAKQYVLTGFIPHAKNFNSEKENFELKTYILQPPFMFANFRRISK